MTLAATLCAIAVCAAPAQADYNWVAKGRWECNNRGRPAPLVGARVDFYEENFTAVDWFDGKVGSTHTDANGDWSFNLRSPGNIQDGDDNFYARVTLDDDAGDVTVSDWHSLSDWNIDTPTNQNDKPVQDYGVRRINTDPGNSPKCAIFQGAHNAYQDFQADTGTKPPMGDYSIVTDAFWVSTPATRTQTTYWPAGYSTGHFTGQPDDLSTNYHEFAHSVRASLDGSVLHFALDGQKYDYGRSHSFCDVTNPGFAFNEGWAEFWAGAYKACGSPAGGDDVEGDVASRLADLLGCRNIHRSDLVNVLRGHPGAIHSWTEFNKFFTAEHACVDRRDIPDKLAGGEAERIKRGKLRASLKQSIKAATRLERLWNSRFKSAKKALRDPPPCQPQPCLKALEKTVKVPFSKARAQQAGLLASTLKWQTTRKFKKLAKKPFGTPLANALSAHRKAFDRGAAKFMIAATRKALKSSSRLNKLDKTGVIAAKIGVMKARLADMVKLQKNEAGFTGAFQPFPTLAPGVATYIGATPFVPPTPPPQKKASTLTLDCGSSGTIHDTPHPVSGSLKPGVAGSTVTITYTHPADSTSITHNATTDANGDYNDGLTAAETSDYGQWYAKAHFAGDSTRLASDSQSCGFIVGSP